MARARSRPQKAAAADAYENRPAAYHELIRRGFLEIARERLAASRNS